MVLVLAQRPPLRWSPLVLSITLILTTCRSVHSEVECPKADPDHTCINMFEPAVCGDNACEYPNVCYAEAAGFVQGECRHAKEGESKWETKAADTAKAKANDQPVIVLDPSLTQQAVDFATRQLEIAESTDTTFTESIQRGEGESLYKIANYMVEHSSTTTNADADADADASPADYTAGMAILHMLADTHKHIESQVALGFAYYKKENDNAYENSKQRALDYFEQAGQAGPHQAALFNAGRIHSELGQVVPAMAFLAGAVTLAETHPNYAKEALTATCRKAFAALSQLSAGNSDSLTVHESADLFMYASLEDKLTDSDLDHWREAMTNLLTIHNTLTAAAAAQAPALTVSALLKVFRDLRDLWEESADKLSPLQAHLLLKHANNVLLLASTLDDDLLPTAAEYAHALALSEYCYKHAVDVKNAGAHGNEQSVCFNVAISNAAAYNRLAGQDTDSVFELAVKHPSAATQWKLSEQSPVVFYPELTAKPIWKAQDFAIVQALELAYMEKSETIRNELQPLGTSSAGAVREQRQVETTVQGETIATNNGVGEPHRNPFHHNPWSPRIRSRISSTSDQDEVRLGGWAELTLFDGSAWDKKTCGRMPTLCKALQSQKALLCTTKNNKGHFCGSHNAVVGLVRVEPGATVFANGHTNARLVMHLPLEGCQGVELKFTKASAAGDKILSYDQDGHAVVLDDSFQYVLAHGGSDDCYLVTALLAHPDLSSSK